MAARTIENCSIIQRCVKAGIGEPQRWYNIERCEGMRLLHNVKNADFIFIKIAEGQVKKT